MTWADTIRDFLPPVDPRNPREIECDIEDEFSFHLAMLEREERAAGCDESTAKSQARKRFGDIDRVRKKCKKIALEERVMLQRINLVLSIVVLLFVGLVGWQVWTTQKYNTLALQAITSDLAKMKFDAEAEARTSASDVDKSDSTGVVYLTGMGETGQYELPADGEFTLSRLLAAAKINMGVVTLHVTIRRRLPNASDATIISTNTTEFLSDSSKDVLLQPNDLVSVSLRPSSAIEDRNGDTQDLYDLRDLPGVWRLVDREDLPEVFQLLFVNDRGQRVPEGMIKQGATPATSITVEQIGLSFTLRPVARTVQNSELMQLEVKINPSSGSPSERYGNPQITVYSTWSAPAANQIALQLDPLLKQMTAEAAATATPWLEKPLVYERVTAPYSDVVKVGWPVQYHLLGDIPNPGPRKMSAREPLMLQKVLWEQNFGEIENGVAQLFIPTVDGPRSVARLGSDAWDHEAYAEIEVPPDSVIYITRDAANTESSAAPKPPSSQGVVYIDGDLLRRGTYALPANGKLTLSRLLATAGVSPESDHRVTVRRKSDGAVLQDLMVDIPVTKLKEDATLDIVIEADDLVIVNSSN